MKIQTLSVVVPTKRCVNNCKFCVSKTHDNPYHNMFNDECNYVQYRKNIKKRLQFALLHGVDTIILTGTGEVLQNKKFLEVFNQILFEMNNPFPRIEIQTTGVMLTDENLQFLKDIEVNTISLSVSNIFNDEKNIELIGIVDKLKFDLKSLCERIKKYNFNIRLSLNLTNDYKEIQPIDYFNRSNELGATHLTFRKLYASNNNTPEDNWVKENKLSDEYIDNINIFIQENGRSLYVLPFGFIAYSVMGISTILDDNCMSVKTDIDDILKYLILREDGKLYTLWDDPGSLLF
jgi:sulfatase maturation enzyme AslB (radical SAM superfamily)